MKKTLVISILSLAFFFFSCEKDEEIGATENAAIVEAFLYEGSASIDVKLTEMTPFEQLGTTEATVISDAAVYVSIDEQDFLLEEVDDSPGLYTSNDSAIKILSGQDITFYLKYLHYDITAQTTVPQKPQHLEISEDTLYIDEISTLMDLTNIGEMTVEISWSNPDNSYYYVAVNNIENDPESIDPNDLIPDVENINTPPLPTDFSILWINDLSDYGTYEIVVYKVNDEYIDLYNSRQQDSRTLNEPLTNVENAYGIFTSLASDTVYLEIIRP
jgi:hypothetical protein